MYELNTAGYDLIDLGNGDWGLNIRKGSLYLGRFKDVIKRAISLGFTYSALEQGIAMMTQNDHDSIHFGMFGLPIFSFNRGENSERKAS